MRKIALVVGATLAISGTALASATAYDVGVYAGNTSQTTADSPNIAMKVTPGEMKKMVYEVNFRCADKQGNRATLSNHKTTLGAATISSSQQVNAIYHLSGGNDDVHLQMTLNHGKAAGNIKEALLINHNGRTYECVTPGGQATVAGKVFFAMTWQHS